MLARHRSLELAVFRHSKDSKHSDRSWSVTYNHHYHLIFSHDSIDRMYNSVLTFSPVTGKTYSAYAVTGTYILYHNAHQLQYECLWQWPSGVLSVLASPSPECFSRPASTDRRSALNLSQYHLCCCGAGPSPTGSRTAPDLQMSSPDPPRPVCEAPLLPHHYNWCQGHERVRGKSQGWRSGH